MHSWRVLVLPFLDQQQLYARYNFSEPWDGPNNSRLLVERPAVFRLHGIEDESATVTNYLAIVGSRTMWPPAGGLSAKLMPDSLGSTISVVENVGSNIAWMEPRDLNLETISLSLPQHPVNGISSWLDPPAIVTADGTVMSLNVQMSEDDLRAMILRDDTLPGNRRDLSAATELQDGRDRPLRQGAPQ